MDLFIYYAEYLFTRRENYDNDYKMYIFFPLFSNVIAEKMSLAYEIVWI